MLPDALHFQTDRMIAGKVFSFELDSASGVGRRERKVGANLLEWDDCVQCPEYEHCYRYCMAKMELEAAIAAE
jgi:hypothetical protein